MKGSRRVPVTTSGNERTRVSAAFTAAANGSVYLLIPRKKPIQEIFILTNVVVE